MIDINDIPSILSAWPIEPIAACERIRNHDVFAIHTTGQRRWVLKYTHGRQVVARLDSDYVLLRYLHDAGVPVAVPLLTRDKHCYATGNEGVFTLHPNLLPVRPLPVCDVQRRNWNLGASLCRLHRALAAYPGEIKSWEMNLHRRVFAELAPGVRDFLCHKRPQAAAALEMLDAAMRDSFGNLPAQYIHGDSHQGNILTDGDEVVGFVDLDHLPKGPRIYDIGYVLVDMIKWDIQDPDKSSRWIRDFNAVVKGYDHGQALSQREKGGILYVMLAVQMLMTEEFLKRNNMPWAELNAEAFFWLFEHRENIQKQIFQ